MVITWPWMILAGLVGFVIGVAASYYAGFRMWREEKEEHDHTSRELIALRKKPFAANNRVEVDSNPILIPPPMVGDVTVMQWAIHYHKQAGTPGAQDDPEYGVWATMIAKMYRRASNDIGIARHFNFTDMAALQKKFTATLCLVLNSGLRAKAVKAMEKVHEPYDITPAEYDRVCTILLDILEEYKIPAQGIEAVIQIATALKPVIAKHQPIGAA